jgi:hypothetical protein
MAIEAGLRVQYQHGDDGDPNNAEIKPYFRIVNDSSASVPLSELKLRYFYTREGTSDETSDCYWAQVGCGNIGRSNQSLVPEATGVNRYFEVSFGSGAGSLAAQSNTGDIKVAFHKNDWTNYSEADDFSYVPGQTAWADAPKVTLYRNGVLVWGSEPGGGGQGGTGGGGSGGTAGSGGAGGTPGCSPPDCNDNNPCTTDACSSGTCTHTPASTDPACAQLTSADLKLEVLTNSCGQNQAQQFFRVTNTGSVPVTLSDIAVRYWVNDSSAVEVVPHVWTGGCLTDASGCFHQVSGVTSTAAAFSPACGPDAAHQASREITILNTDGAMLAPGVRWTNLQTAVNLADYSNFNPGTNSWFSPCLTGADYATDNHFAIYYQGKLVFSSGINAPDCRSPHGTQRTQGYVTPAMASAPLVGPVPQSTVLRLSISLPARDPEGLKSFVRQVSDPASPTYRQFLTLDEFTATYGPLEADYQALKDWADSKGLTIVGTYPNRLLLDVSGTVSAIERALYVNLNYYSRPDGSQFYAPDRDPSLDLAVTVLSINGLDSFLRPRSLGVGPGKYDGTDIRKAYVPCAGSDQLNLVLLHESLLRESCEPSQGSRVGTVFLVA